MHKAKKDVAGAIGFIILFAAFFVMVKDFPAEVQTYPKIVCGAGVLFSIILLVRSVAALQASKGRADEEARMTRKQLFAVLLTIAISLAYVALISIVGYFVMTFIFLIGFAYYLDPSQKKIVYPIVALVFNVALYFGFAKFLNVSLPHGFLF